MANSFSGYGSMASARPDLLNTVATDHSRFSYISDQIGTNIFTINAGSTTLERIMKQIGTPRDKPGLRDNIHTTQQKTNSIILSTTQLMRELSSLIRTGDKQQKLRTGRLRDEFQVSVERYTSLQKQMAEKIRKTYSFPKSNTSGFNESDDSAVTEKTALLEEEARQTFEQQQIMRDLEFEQALVQEREQRIRQLEENILDVNQIFSDLAVMVHEQGEVINTIDANIDRAYNNVETGTTQLRTASEYQKKYRKKICCFAVLILIVAVILTVILVLSLKT